MLSQLPIQCRLLSNVPRLRTSSTNMCVWQLAAVATFVFFVEWPSQQSQLPVAVTRDANVFYLILQSPPSLVLQRAATRHRLPLVLLRSQLKCLGVHMPTNHKINVPMKWHAPTSTLPASQVACHGRCWRTVSLFCWLEAYANWTRRPQSDCQIFNGILRLPAKNSISHIIQSCQQRDSRLLLAAAHVRQIN